MGGHYGSIQVRSEDRDRVKAAAEEVAVARKIHCLISPAQNGWISIFPELHGQDETVGRDLARKLKEDMIHLLVHDDDIFAYWLYRDHKLADSFHSSPGHFGEENRAAEEKMTGNPEAFRPILGDKINLLPPLLARDKSFGPFAHEQMKQFAKVLGIANSVNAYEYLKDGERSGIKAWRKFDEIPASQAKIERQARSLAKKRINEERRQLRDAGLLLAYDERKETHVYTCPAGRGFLVTRPDFRNRTALVNLYAEPWDKPKPLNLGPETYYTDCSSDLSAKRVAVFVGDRIRVWDVADDEWKQIADLAPEKGLTGMAMSADGRQLAQGSHEEIVVSQFDGSQDRIPVEGGNQNLAFHPSGDWLAVAGDLSITLVSVRETPRVRRLYIGGKSLLAAGLGALMQQKFAAIDLKEMEKQYKKTADQMVKRMSAFAGKSMKGASLSPAQVDDMTNTMRKTFEEQKARIIALKEGRTPPPPPQANERCGRVGFSRNGRWFWCGTDGGLRVFNWSTMPKEHNADLLKPTWGFEPPQQKTHRPISKSVRAITEEIDTQAIVFGGNTGYLYRLDLLSGELRELIKIGDNSLIFDISMSADGKALGVATHNLPIDASGRRGRFGEQSWTYQVWSYPKLRDSFKE